MSKRRKTAQRKAVIKSTALHIAVMTAFGLWAVGAQLMTQGGTMMDNQRQIEINRAHQYLADKMLARKLKRLDRVYYFIVTLVVTTTLGGFIAFINSIWSL